MMVTAAIGLPVAALLFYLLYVRPQRGLLLLAAGTPFHGLLVIIPGGAALTAWKEGLILLTLAATFVSPNRPRRRGLWMPWWPAVAAWVGFGIVSGLVVYGIGAATPIKITYFYIVLLWILWRTPFDARDRDHLVSLIMGIGFVTAVIGLLQQVVGAEFLVSLGYGYNEYVRTAGGILRSFSTFQTPFAFGLFVMLSLLIGVAVALSEPRRLRNLVFLCVTPIMVFGMGVSIVRASYLGLVLGLLWIGVHRHKVLAWGLAALAASAPLALLFVPANVLNSVFSSNSLGQRSGGWAETLSNMLTHPLGQGLGATGSAAYKVLIDKNPQLANVQPAQGEALGLTPYQPDNYYVKTMIELGPIGLWLIVLILVCAVSTTLGASRVLPGRDGALAIGVSASVVAAMAASLVSTYFEIFPLDVYFWLLLGTVGCAVQQNRSGSERSPSNPAAAESKLTPVNS
ncbi:O-antigen ligase family protein [Actinomycetes bacterium M1A6_2h]